MTVLPRRTSLQAGLLFPPKSSEFNDCFIDSNYSGGVCFSFAIFFLQGHPINPRDDDWKSKLMMLQSRHRASVAAKSIYLKPNDFRLYKFSFEKKLDITSIDIPTITSILNQWATENNDQVTKTIVAISASTPMGDVKHFLPLAYIPTTATWEVGDTSFSLGTDGSVIRYEILNARLEAYLNWQIGDIVRDNPIRKITLIHLVD